MKWIKLHLSRLICLRGQKRLGAPGHLLKTCHRCVFLLWRLPPLRVAEGVSWWAGLFCTDSPSDAVSLTPCPTPASAPSEPGCALPLAACTQLSWGTGALCSHQKGTS